MVNRYTAGYVRKNNKYLFMFRNKKSHDINHGKWIGIGGRVEEHEDPDTCMDRETFEETGLIIREKRYCGEVVNRQVDGAVEALYVYLITEVHGELKDSCDEGDLAWMTWEEFLSAPHWESDEPWLKKALQGEFFDGLEALYDGDQLLARKWREQN